MISASLLGGMGNNLFQIANALARAKESNCDVRIPKTVERYHFGPLNGSLEVELERIFADTSYLRDLEPASQWVGNWRTYTHQDMAGGFFGYSKPALPGPGEDLCYVGYFQSHKYFDGLERGWLGLRPDLHEKVLNLHRPHPKDSIAIHWRAGGDRNRADTLPYHPVVSMDFYRRSIELIKGKAEIANPSIYVISQAPGSVVMENFGKLADDVVHVDSSVEDSFALMALCAHVIIGNSTFSWWGAMASEMNPIVVAPKTEWFGPSNSHLYKEDLFPENWICL